MSKYETRDIRNIALVGHGTAGKTSLTELMLNKAGQTKRVGKVEEKNTLSDFEDQEKERQHSINNATLYFDWKKKHFNLIDCPGYPDFFGEVVCAVEAVDTAAIVIDANSGIRVNTKKSFHAAEDRDRAIFLIVNRMDTENASFEKIVESARSNFGNECTPVVIPNGEGSSFEGIDFIYGQGDPSTDEQKAMVEKIVELAVETDDELMMSYLEGEEIDPKSLQKAVMTAISSRKIIPILACSVTEDKGVEEVMDFLAKYALSPEFFVVNAYEGEVEDQRRAALKEKKKLQDKLEAWTEDSDEEKPDPESVEIPESQPVELKAETDGPFVARVFKIIKDPYVGKLSFFRVFSGTLETKTQLKITRTDNVEKIGDLLRVQGSPKNTENADKAIPGDIMAVAKVEEIKVGDTITSEEDYIELETMDFPTPMVAQAVQPKARGDEGKIGQALQALSEEDQTFVVHRNDQTNELIVKGMSDLHLNIMLKRMLDRFEVDVVTSIPKIPYKETIQGTEEKQYKHKKQSGGRGQFGEVYIRLEPLPRGSGFDFVNNITGGVIPNTFIPAVEKGIREAMSKGVIAGYPVTDFRVTLYDGSHHAVDSSETAFKIAGSKAFQLAVQEASPVILEPIYDIEVTVSNNYMGDIMGDLNSRRAIIQNTKSINDLQVIIAKVPLSEVTTYSTQLRSMTGGEGMYTLEFSHYDIAPPPVAQKVIQESKRDSEE